MIRLTILLMLLTFSAYGHDFAAGDLRIVHPFAVPGVQGATTGAAYLSIENRGKTADKLIAAGSVRAKRIELHRTSTTDGIARMREVESIGIGPGETIKMRPGNGFHLMLADLSSPLKEGETFRIQLTFEKAGKVEVKAYVQTPKASSGAHSH